jgi:hypothetical protein
MTSQKFKAAEFVPSKFPEPDQDRIIPALLGKKAAIVTDDRDMHVENVVTAIVMHNAGAGTESRPVSYSEFFDSPPQAEILILRSSRIFSLEPRKLIGSLERFRSENPKSAVIVCAFENSVISRLQPLLESGIINAIETHPPDDRQLLAMGAAIFQKLHF